jgi:hypothetical protein
MERSQASATDGRPSRVAIISALLSGSICMVVGIALLYIVFGGAFMTRFIPTGRPSTYELIIGILAWAFGLAGPTGFILLGVARLSTGYKRWQARSSQLSGRDRP